MRVTLIHNEDAGYERYTTKSLIARLRKHGYDAIHAADRLEGLHDPGELVVAAGGDGTVRKVARHLVGRDIPMAILPIGTANNIATSLGIAGDPATLIAGWDIKKRRRIDAGLVNRNRKESVFIESVGFGMFPKLMRQRADAGKCESREAEIAEALSHQLDIVRNYPCHPATLRLDDETREDAFLMIEIMNINDAGPKMRLAPKARPDDGLLDVVLVTEGEREAFCDYLSASLSGGKAAHGLEVVRARRVSIEWRGAHYHVDDQIKARPAPIRLGTHLIPKALSILR